VIVGVLGVGIVVLLGIALVLARRQAELVATAERRRLEALDRVSAIAGTLGHDLIGPLDAIADVVLLLQERPLDAEARGLLDELVESMQLASERVDALTRYAQGTQAPSTTTAPAAEVINAAARLANGGLEVKRGGDLSAPLPRALINVLANLLTNARRYTLAGRDPIAWVEVAEAAHAVTIRVRDKGRGFEPRFADEIFRLYRRLYPDVPGTGMGLSIVRDLVARLGGTVQAYSDGPGKGATFTITIPRGVRS